MYLQPADWYEPSIGEYLVPHMPLYPAFCEPSGTFVEHLPWYRLLFDRVHGRCVVTQFGLRYLATAVLWLFPIGAVWYVLRRPTAHPLLLLPQSPSWLASAQSCCGG